MSAPRILTPLLLCIGASLLATPARADPIIAPLDESEATAVGGPTEEHEEAALVSAEGEAPAAAFFVELSPTEVKASGTELRALVEAVRGAVLAKVSAKIAAKQSDRLATVAAVLMGISLAGGLLLFAPLVLRRRFPGKQAVLWKYSALAALLFFLAVNLFSAVLLTMRSAQAVTGEATNPQIKLASASFELLSDKAEDLAPVMRSLIVPSINAMREDGDATMVVVLLENVQKLAADFKVFSTVAKVFSKLEIVFGILPLVFIGIAILLFVQAAKPTLVAIVSMPARAASGERGVGGAQARETLRAVWHELKATLSVIAIILAVTAIAGLLLGYVLVPAIEIFLAYLVVCLMYVQITAEASSVLVLVSLLGCVLFLVANLAVIVTGSALYLGKAQKIFQQKFRLGVPLRSHKKFWRWGTASLLWSQLLPLVYIVAFSSIVEWVVLKSMETESWPLILAGGPLLFLASFALVFWAARGTRALGFLKRYKPGVIAGEVLQRSVTTHLSGAHASGGPGGRDVAAFVAREGLARPAAPTTVSPEPAASHERDEQPEGHRAPHRAPRHTPEPFIDREPYLHDEPFVGHGASAAGVIDRRPQRAELPHMATSMAWPPPEDRPPMAAEPSPDELPHMATSMGWAPPTPRPPTSPRAAKATHWSSDGPLPGVRTHRR